MKIDVKPDAVLVWIWDPRGPPASPYGLASVIALRNLMLVHLQVLSNGKLLELRMAILKTSDIVGNSLYGVPVVETTTRAC